MDTSKSLPEIPIKSKLPNTGLSIFAVMSNMAHNHNAINLSQGFPDFPISEKLIELTHHYMKKGYNQYAPYTGILPLRQALAFKMKNIHGVSLNPETEINITSGATEAIYSTITTLINEGDEVIIFEPYYDCYVPSVKLNGGIPIFIPLEGDDFSINWEAVKNRVNARTRMIILNTPHNPSGTVLRKKDIVQLEKLIDNTDIILLSDEVYQHIIFDGIEHHSMLRYPKLKERSVSVFSFGKTYHSTGWKMGYVIAPKFLMKEIRKVHQFVVFSSMTPVQYALADYLKDEKEYLSLNQFYQDKRDLFLELMKDTKFKFVPSRGTYFQLADYSDISDMPDLEFAEKLTKEYGVAAIPVSAFYSQKPERNYLRFCFAKSEETLKKAAEKLKKL